MAVEDSVAQDQLRAFIERIERMEEEKAAISADIKEIYAEAKGNGFDTKILRKIVTIRKQDANERMEQEALLEMYMDALGMVQAHEQAMDQALRGRAAPRSAPLAADRIETISEPLRTAPTDAVQMQADVGSAPPASLAGAEGIEDRHLIHGTSLDGVAQTGPARASAPLPVESRAVEISTPTLNAARVGEGG